MTPEEALSLWEEFHHDLSEEHRASFKLKAHASGILDYPVWAVRPAIKETKLLADATTEAAAILARVREIDRAAAAKRDQSKERSPKPRPPAPKRSTSKKNTRRKGGSRNSNKPMENTDPYLSASGSGMVRNWGNRKARPAVTSDERAMCKACDRPAINCAC